MTADTYTSTRAKWRDDARCTRCWLVAPRLHAGQRWLAFCGVVVDRRGLALCWRTQRCVQAGKMLIEAEWSPISWEQSRRARICNGWCTLGPVRSTSTKELRVVILSSFALIFLLFLLHPLPSKRLDLSKDTATPRPPPSRAVPQPRPQLRLFNHLLAPLPPHPPPALAQSSPSSNTALSPPQCVHTLDRCFTLDSPAPRYASTRPSTAFHNIITGTQLRKLLLDHQICGIFRQQHTARISACPYYGDSDNRRRVN
ncbi:hypothetical protein NA57DRAFT_52603 [Rhizodiscina lignyota]|uniref:Uncharacterized protein n=1 Tax=Rhizodiscina lignyota TaxID=1504668 RepID=A0A9P4IRA6_9PEZI|nr:hypothetical protein NA57DRAFT_52603 [Rhizodiscina lignyota]